MPIIKLTDYNTLIDVKRGIPIVGDFRKGEERDDNGRWGKDLENGSWRVTFREDYEMFEDAFNQIFADTREPFIIATIDQNPDDVFNDYYRLYGGNGLAQIVCTGDKIQFSADNKQSACMDCPDKRGEAKSAKEKAKYCAPNAYFRFTIPKFNRAMQMPVPFLFQFNVTSITELQHIKKELYTAYMQKGTLINELFLLYRNNRRFNRGGMANDKSLAYTLWLDKNLDEKAQEAQLKLESGEIQQPEHPALPAPDSPIDEPIPDDELSSPSQESQADQRQAYIDKIRQWIDERFDMDEEAFLFQCGAFTSIEQLIDRFPEQGKLSDHIIEELCIKKRIMVKIYGVRTEKHRNTTRMIIPFGFGVIHSYTRKDFGEWESIARRGYGEPNEKGEYPYNIATPGDHSFQQVFSLPYLSLELGLTNPDKANEPSKLKINKITGDLPF